jgi:hypothetical protein
LRAIASHRVADRPDRVEPRAPISAAEIIIKVSGLPNAKTPGKPGLTSSKP